MAYRTSVPPSPSPSQRSERYRSSTGLQAEGRPGSGRSARSAGQRHSTGSSIYGYLVGGENKSKKTSSSRKQERKEKIEKKKSKGNWAAMSMICHCGSGKEKGLFVSKFTNVLYYIWYFLCDGSMRALLEEFQSNWVAEVDAQSTKTGAKAVKLVMMHPKWVDSLEWLHFAPRQHRSLQCWHKKLLVLFCAILGISSV